MSKKTLNVAGIKNELEGASLYFTKPTTPPPPVIEPSVLPEPVQATDAATPPEIKVRTKRSRVVKIKTTEANQLNDLINEPTFERTKQRTNVLTKDRTKIRHTFDIFADQLLVLREISLNKEKLFGERVLLGDLVQQALDMFIAKEKNK
jgi:hypothetical protein